MLLRYIVWQKKERATGTNTTNTSRNNRTRQSRQEPSPQQRQERRDQRRQQQRERRQEQEEQQQLQRQQRKRRYYEKYAKAILPFAGTRQSQLKNLPADRVKDSFIQFVDEYDATMPFDVHLRLQVASLANPSTGQTQGQTLYNPLAPQAVSRSDAM